MNNVTFQEWDMAYNDYKIYAINHGGYYVARILLMNKDNNKYNSVLSFHSKKDFNTDVLIDVSIAIKEEFGDIKFVIGTDG